MKGGDRKAKAVRRSHLGGSFGIWYQVAPALRGADGDAIELSSFGLLWVSGQDVGAFEDDDEVVGSSGERLLVGFTPGSEPPHSSNLAPPLPFYIVDELPVDRIIFLALLWKLSYKSFNEKHGLPGDF